MSIMTTVHQLIITVITDERTSGSLSQTMKQIGLYLYECIVFLSLSNKHMVT